MLEPPSANWRNSIKPGESFLLLPIPAATIAYQGKDDTLCYQAN